MVEERRKSKQNTTRSKMAQLSWNEQWSSDHIIPLRCLRSYRNATHRQREFAKVQKQTEYFEITVSEQKTSSYAFVPRSSWVLSQASRSRKSMLGERLVR